MYRLPFVIRNNIYHQQKLLNQIIFENKMVFSSIFGNSCNATNPFQTQLDSLQTTENQLLSFASQFVPSQVKSHHNKDVISATQVNTKISKKQIFDERSSSVDCQVNSVSDADEHMLLHSVKISNDKGHSKNNIFQKSEQTVPLVLQHGYANAALYFYRNLYGMCLGHFSEIHALDMLGWGLSSRPKFLTEKNNELRSAEKFFVESLEEWRKANKIEKMTLAGHSMGGYLSVAYCEKYPHRVDNLILISPVGVPEVDEEVEKEKYSKVPFRYKLLFGTMRAFWRSGITPGSFMRSLTEYRGRRMVEGYVNGRLPMVQDEDEKAALSEYLYTNSILPGSGEYVLNHVLKPGAYARDALVNRIPKLKVPRVSFLYGQVDWMDINGGLEVQKICEENAAAGIESPNIVVYEVNNAGHLLMLENWHEFNTCMIMAGGGKVNKLDPRPSIVHHSTYVKAPRRFG